ncbi:MAG TPA: copper chaperone PCu(A)C [Hyphomicrobiaceae bacterium]|nr:copper chaperone PCu(A)C [Hyphomicrobiaceae bacterium]
MRRVVFILAALIALVLRTDPALAGEHVAGAIRISDLWARATPKGARTGSAYMTLTNTGSEADRLVGGTAEPSRAFELHRMSMDGGIMKMRAVSGGIAIGPGQTVQLEPGGYHAMLIDLKEALLSGQRFKGTLVFEKAGTVEVEYEIRAVGAGAGTAPAKGGHGGHHGK